MAPSFENYLKRFKPSPRAKVIYFLRVFNLVFLVLVAFLIAVVMAFLRVEIFYSYFSYIVIASITIFITGIIISAAYSIAFYNSVVFEVRDDGILKTCGVIFKTMKVIPYSKITNIEIVQGPILRLLGLVSIYIQTAGYSGQYNLAEMEIEGIDFNDAEEIRNLILQKIKS